MFVLTSMDDIMSVAKIDSFENLLYTFWSDLFGIELTSHYVFKQFPTSDEVKYDIVTENWFLLLDYRMGVKLHKLLKTQTCQSHQNNKYFMS